MKKLSTGEILSICSMMVSILLVALKDETDKLTQIIILAIFCALVVGYGIFLIYRTAKFGKGISSAAIIAKAKKFTGQLVRLANANARQLKRFDFFAGQKSIEKRNKELAAKCKGDLSVLRTDATQKAKKAQLNEEIRRYTVLKSQNYGDLEALKSYNAINKVMSEASLQKHYLISREIIKRVFDMNRILLQLEQHNTRIKLGKYVAYFTNDEETQIKAYMDLIGWSYILLGNNRKGFDAILNSIHIIESRIGEKFDGKIPEGVTKETYYRYLMLKVRAYRHLGSTYYTYKNIDAIKYCEAALKILDSEGFKQGFNDDIAYENMRCGVLNNLYLGRFYRFVEDTRRGKGDINMLSDTLNMVNANIDELYAMPDGKRDIHRLLKLLSLKSQLSKAMDISGVQKLDMEQFDKDLSTVEKILNKNIYFDDAMEVYANQKVQQVFEEVKNILMD